MIQEGNKMDIVLCIDNNYIMPCGVTMTSILENHKEYLVTFHIIGLELTEESKNVLSKLCSRYNQAFILFYHINKDTLASYKSTLENSKHLSLATYSRLYIEKILPNNLDKVLYLDCDIIVVNKLTELWDTNLNGYAIAGVKDLYIINSRPDAFERLDYPIEKGYINAGVLLINLSYWRTENLMNKFLDFITRKKDCLAFHDQDIINGTLYDNMLLLPFKFNLINNYYMRGNTDIIGYETEIYEAMSNPVIIHFTSSEKPWSSVCLHPMKREFVNYKKLYPWKKENLVWSKIKFCKKIRYIKRKIFYKLNLKTPIFLVIKKDLNTGKYIINR